MEWTKLKEQIYYTDGSCRDIYVLNTKINDWEEWKRIVEENFTISIYYSQLDAHSNSINISNIAKYWKGNGGYGVAATIDIGEIKIKCQFFREFEIENNFDPAQIESLIQHDRLMKYLALISERLKKKVFVTPEGQKDKVLIEINTDLISFPTSH